jgi:hypothetical protein
VHAIVDAVIAQTTAKPGTSDNSVAIIGLVVAGIVGLAGPAVAAFFAARRQKREIAAAETRQTAELDAAQTRQIEALEAERVRQDAALTAERERLERQLDAERERQAAQLAHARELADLADLRSLLDEAAVALYHADTARADVRQGTAMHGRLIGERRPKALQELNARGQALDAMAARLAIRLGAADDVARAFRGASDELVTISRALGWLEDDDQASWRAKREGIYAASDAFEQHVQDFERRAVRRTAARIGDGEAPAW